MSKTTIVETPSVNIIGNGTDIIGDINSNGDFRIDGLLKGTIKSTGKVVVGSTGKVEGEIICQNADFSGEVERTLNMADGALLIIDAQEGPMPQTKFVLKKALELGLKIIVVINKIDKQLADISKTVEETNNLFLELATHTHHLDFPIFYAIGKEGKAAASLEELKESKNLEPILNEIIKFIPAPKVETGSFQMLVSNLDYDAHKGKHAIGRIKRGNINKGEFNTY